MLFAILIIMILPVTDLGRTKGLQFRPISKIAFYIFVTNFLILMQLGAKHVETPFIEFGQISTALYFAYFLVIMPAISVIENTLVDLNLAGYYTNLGK
jgi:ubiquinol-cytochrome c reductase cytochrome b subunit